MDETRIKKFVVKVIFKTRADLVLGLNQILHEIETGETDDVGNDYIAEVQNAEETAEAGYAYHVEEYEYADIYANPKEGATDAENKKEN